MRQLELAARPTVEGQELIAMAAAAVPRKLRPMGQWAEEEIVVPDGPYKGQPFRLRRQPFARLWFEAVDSGDFQRFVGLGPSQSGKTLCCFAIPAVYFLCELGESVILGLPDMRMANDKWLVDLEPVIANSRYRDLLPIRGEGSRGGKVQDKVRFRNGAILKFMSGGGSDKSRAAFTARVLVVTETDGMDEAGGGSREADKITQLEARLAAYQRRYRRTFLECTVSIESGRTWREYVGGTKSRIGLPCVSCGEYVTSEREQLQGWQDAETLRQAESEAHFCCPQCGARWSEDDRREMNLAARLIHDGQTLTSGGEVLGELPETDTLGFRWSPVNNLLLTAGDVGVEEWKADRDPDDENAEKKLRQFVWALPYIPEVYDVAPLEPEVLRMRKRKTPRGVIPDGAEYLTVGVDVGKWLLHWVAIAWHDGASGTVIDYNVQEVPSRSLGAERAIMAALRSLFDSFAGGWRKEDLAETAKPDQVFVDAGYKNDVVYEFVRDINSRGGDDLNRYRPSMGHGEAQAYERVYARPKSTGNVVRHIGEDYHIAYMKAARVYLVEINADAWKTWLHERLSTPLSENGSIGFFDSEDRNEHFTLSKHLTAEKAVEEFQVGKGNVTTWRTVRRANHYLDAMYLAAAAGHLSGARLIRQTPKARKETVQERRRSSEPFLITERR